MPDLRKQETFSPLKIEFYGQEIQALEREGVVWIGVADVCQNLGITSHRQIQKIKENQLFQGRSQHMLCPTGQGIQETFFIQKDVFLLWLGSISAAKVKEEARELLVKYQLELMRVIDEYFTHGFVMPSLTAEEEIDLKFEMDILRSMKANIQARQELRVQKRMIESNTQRIGAVEGRVDGMQKNQEEALLTMNRFPQPTVEAAQPSLRSIIDEYVKKAAVVRGLPYKDAFSKVYREYRKRYRVDIPKKARNAAKREKKKSFSSLEMAERLDVLETLYAVAVEIFPFSREENLSTSSLDPSLV